MRRMVLFSVGVVLLGAGEVPGQSLEDRVRILAEEVRQLREQIVLPESDAELESWGGLGPAASKVYAKTSGLALGGYGEFYFAAPTGADDAVRVADFYRFITYVGYKFNDRVLMNTELEIEHATTSANFDGSAGSVSVEFSYLDFLIRDELNVRAGNLLVPAGIVNEMHEPPFYRGNFRPEIERRLIPSTWRELGVGLHGKIVERVAYKLYVLNGLNAKKFGAKGVRDGRQKGNRVLWEDVAGVLSLRVEAANPVTVGGSVFVGGADQGQPFDGRKIDATTTIAEGHLEVRHRGLTARALVATTSIGEAGTISADEDVDATVPERQIGWYAEAGYDVGPGLGLRDGMGLVPWARYEAWELHLEVPGGRSVDDALNGRSIAFGVDFRPHPQVVVKADLTLQDTDAGGPTEDPLRVGAGFVF